MIELKAPNTTFVSTLNKAKPALAKKEFIGELTSKRQQQSVLFLKRKRWRNFRQEFNKSLEENVVNQQELQVLTSDPNSNTREIKSNLEYIQPFA